MLPTQPTPPEEATPIDGVRLLSLATHPDERGSFTELFRRTWVDVDFRQWNIAQSAAGVLRGVHVHKKHFDFIVVVDGAGYFGMRDLRHGSPTEGRTFSVTLTGARLRVLRIPPGVAHGFCFTQPTTHVYGVSEYWNLADELGCRYDDPDLELRWPVTSPLISARDAALPSLRALLPEVPAWQPAPASAQAAQLVDR